MSDVSNHSYKLEEMFLSCYNVSLINWPEFINSSWKRQKDLIDGTILNKLNCEMPIKKSYQISFLKKIIETLESLNAEIHDEIYESFCVLQSQKCEEKFSHKHYQLSKFSSVISLKESTNFVSSGTTGLCSWQASLALSDWLLQHRQDIEGKSILELGSGTGLAGLVASKLCNAKDMIMSDGNTVVLDLLNENLRKNIKFDTISTNDRCEDNLHLYEYNSKRIGICHLLWEDIDKLNWNVTMPDILLAADVVYDSSIFHDLTKTIEYCFNLMQNQCKMILAATVRNEKTLTDFLQILANLNFKASLQESVIAKNFHWDQSIPIVIYIITR